MAQTPIRIGLIGVGGMARAHIQQLLPIAGVQITALCDIEPKQIERAKEKFPALADAFVTADYRELLRREDVDAVEIATPHTLHIEEALDAIAAGKHVLCEKPLSDNLDNARAMADLARSANTVVRIGFTFRRAPGVAALRELVTSGTLGRILHIDTRYWCDYASDPKGPMSWRYKGAPGSGALADIGSHVAYLIEFLGGDVQEVSGGRFTTAITERPVPLGAVVGHGQAEVSDTFEPVENDDYASFSAQLEQTVGVVQVSRVAAGHPNGLALEVFGDNGAAKWEQERSGEFQLILNEGPAGMRGYRRVIIGPDHPYFAGGLPMDAPGVGIGQNDGFVFQARAFLEEVAGIDEADSLPRTASFDEGVHKMQILAAVAESAANGGAAVAMAPQRAEVRK
jgi:predicted dehydrogenase